MKHRTALIVAASIAAVVFAAALAVAVNLGILTVADGSPVGQLTTATVSQAAATPAPQYQTETPAPARAQLRTQDYVIKKAGTVRIAFSDDAVRFVEARAKGGWTWKLSQTGDSKLTVTFTHGSDTYAFVAQVDARGRVTARVDHPVTQVAPASGGSSWTAAPAPAAPTSPAAAGEPGEGIHTGGQADD
ncbi:MAG TPA: hypothetical protein VMH50_05590 [Thermoleophilia bacterium]|nr:hypothetical protein [Thermoleophilia bacterium]